MASSRHEALKPGSRSYGRGRDRVAQSTSAGQTRARLTEYSVSVPNHGPQSGIEQDAQNPATQLRCRIPKLQKYVQAMLSKKHRYDEQILKSIPQQRQARCSSLKKFGEMLHQCLREYREEYS